MRRSNTPQARQRECCTVTYSSDVGGISMCAAGYNLAVSLKLWQKNTREPISMQRRMRCAVRTLFSAAYGSSILTKQRVCLAPR